MEHHTRGLSRLLASQGWDEDKVNNHIKTLVNDNASADIAPLDRAMLSYARKLTSDPSTIEKGDIEDLQQDGASDLAIHDLCAIVSYFNFVNRIADGLGVKLEGVD